MTGGSITAGQGTASITVQFPAGLTGSATVSAAETSAAGCGGAAVAVTVAPDNSTAPLLEAASVFDNDNTKVLLTYRANGSGSPNPVQVLRRVAGSLVLHQRHRAQRPRQRRRAAHGGTER